MKIVFKDEFEEKLIRYGVKVRFVNNLMTQFRREKKPLNLDWVVGYCNSKNWAQFVHLFDWGNSPEGEYFWHLLCILPGENEIKEYKRKSGLNNKVNLIREDDVTVFTGQILFYNYPPEPNTQAYIKKLFRVNLENGGGFKLVEGPPIYMNELSPELFRLTALAKLAIDGITPKI